MTESMEMEGVPAPGHAQAQLQPTSPSMKVAMRETAAPPSAMDGGNHHNPASVQLPSMGADGSTVHYPPPHEVWTSAINRLQTQVHYNSSIIETQRRDVARIDSAVDRLEKEMGNVYAVLADLRNQIQTRPATVHDGLDILSTELQNVAGKANEVDSLKMQMELMKRRLKRLEESASPQRSEPPPGAYQQHPEHSVYDQSPAPHSSHGSAPVYVNTPSSQDSRAISSQPPLPPPPPPHLAAPEPQRPASDQPQPSDRPSLPGFRSLDQSSSMASWRPAAGYQPPHPPHPPSAPIPETTSHPREPAPEAAGTGWAAVNVNPSIKRTHLDERPPYDTSTTATSPKRQKLAPLMPRTSYNEGQMVGNGISPPDSAPPGPSRSHSNESQAAFVPTNQSHTVPPPPGLQPSLPGPPPPQGQNLRFVPFQQDGPPPEDWRASAMDGTHRGSPQGRGRGRGGRGRGGRKSAQDLTPEWEASTVPDGYYHSHAAPAQALQQPGPGQTQPRPLSPSTVDRRQLFETPVHAAPGSVSVTTPLSASASTSATPATAQNGPAGPGMYPDPQFAHVTPEQATLSSHGGGGGGFGPAKKTRTKPVRNADGILIRKDGRPDMRSVSSAMNLRKVHAKKEAERLEKGGEGGEEDEGEEGRESADGEGRGDGNGIEGERDRDREEDGHGHGGRESEDTDGEDETARRHRENMRRIFPYGIDAVSTRSVAEQFFPKVEDARRPDVKIEAHVDHKFGAGALRREESRDTMTDGDVVMDGVDGDGHRDGERDGERERQTPDGKMVDGV
ncbi:hypothetical protein M8818_002619 [Zalaria obscura]|uniref:Uncharacterized protein n=1 Tax=Zalaria obscura TaxID=2024903 RepID=A0ACC3SGZ5_9PEZI